MPQRSPSPWPAHVALAALLLALCLASLLIWQQLLSAQQQRIAERVSYQALQWLGSDLAMRWVEPLQGNEAAQQFRLTPAHPNFNLAMQAKASGEPRFSNSFALVQGGHGFILYTPLYIANAQQQPVFDGFLQGVFRVEQLMDELLSNLDNGDFSASLLEAGQPIYRRTPGPTVENLQQVVALQLLNNSNFALRLKPSEHLVQRLSTPLPEFVLGASLIISLLLVAAQI